MEQQDQSQQAASQPEEPQAAATAGLGPEVEATIASLLEGFAAAVAAHGIRVLYLALKRYFRRVAVQLAEEGRIEPAVDDLKRYFHHVAPEEAQADLVALAPVGSEDAAA